MLIHQQDELSDFVKDEINEILERLKKEEPIQYLTGECRFHGMDMIIEPGVLIPRPETEELVDLIIDQNKNKIDLNILDLCTGSGCIALALARNLPFSTVTAVDFSDVALKVGEKNSKKLKTKVNFLKADIFEWTTEEKYDIIVSNPPYVMDSEALKMDRNVLDYEPHEALFVRDENPLQYYKRIVEIAKESLKKNGRLYFEINPLTAIQLKDYMESAGFKDAELVRDFEGKNRFLIAINPEK